MFVGEILEIRHNEVPGSQTWVISDNSLDINEQDVEDFGLEKRFKLSPHNRAESSSTGIYPFPTATSPPSIASASGVGGATLHPLNFDPNLNIAGVENPRNVELVGSELQTQGEYLQEGDDPIIQFKAPYRYMKIENLVSQLLTNFGLHKQDIHINSISNVGEDFHSMGRVGYPTEATQMDASGRFTNSEEWQWTGYATDFMLDTEGVRYNAGINGITEFQGNLYAVSGAGEFYRVHVNERRFESLGNIRQRLDAISNSHPDLRPFGLAAVQGRLFLVARGDMFELHIGEDDEISIRVMNTIGLKDGSNRFLLAGHVVGLTARGDELYIGFRNGLRRCSVSGDTITK